MPAESDVPLADEAVTLTAFLDTGRDAIAALCDGLTEEQARRSLVPSRTTLLGLLQHCVRVEKVWFLEAIGGTGRDELGLPSNDDSFLIEYARHAGHGDILREQILADP